MAKATDTKLAAEGRARMEKMSHTKYRCPVHGEIVGLGNWAAHRRHCRAGAKKTESPAKTTKAAKPAKKGKRYLSPAARARIVAAQKKRWAAFHAGKKAVSKPVAVKPVPPKRVEIPPQENSYGFKVKHGVLMFREGKTLVTVARFVYQDTNAIIRVIKEKVSTIKG